MPYLGKQPANVPVTADDIPDNSITSAKILDGVITIADIANDAVTEDKLANSINTAIAANTAKTGITSGQASAITANTAKVTNATHTGDVTGATALTIADDAVTAAKLANSINTDIATGVTGNTTANAALPKAGGTLTGDLNFGDNVDANFGAGTDLKIYHGGSDSYIDETGTGNLKIRSSGVAVQLETVAGENMVVATVDGSVDLYHNGVKKLETTATGATVTGALHETAPAGKIVQVVKFSPSTTIHITIGSSSPPSFTEFNSSYRLSITPKFSNSILRLTYTGLIGGRNSSTIMSFKFYDITNSSNVGSSTLGSGSSRTFCNASYRTVDSDTNDRHNMIMTAYQAASNTNARTYGVYGAKESGGTLDLNMTSTDNAGCSYVTPNFTIEEIAQ